jgi:hypothetical protein
VPSLEFVIDESLEMLLDIFFFFTHIHFVLFENRMMLVLFCVLSFIGFVSAKSRLYGPGLRAEFQVPVRYFYLETRDDDGNK